MLGFFGALHWAYKLCSQYLQERLDTDQQPTDKFFCTRVFIQAHHFNSLVCYLLEHVGQAISDVCTMKKIHIPANIKETLEKSREVSRDYIVSAGHSLHCKPFTEVESPAPSAVRLAKSLELGSVEATQSPTPVIVEAAQSPTPVIVEELKAPHRISWRQLGAQLYNLWWQLKAPHQELWRQLKAPL